MSTNDMSHLQAIVPNPNSHRVAHGSHYSIEPERHDPTLNTSNELMSPESPILPKYK